MLVYNHTFKFREPYQVLVDSQIVLDCHGSNFDLAKGLQRTLQAEVKVMITQCCMQALYESQNQGAIELAKGFERRRCNHPPKEPKPPIECLESVVSIKGHNKHRYVVASQDVEIRRALRRTPGVPLVHTVRSVMVMEPLSEASAKISEATEAEKLHRGLNDPRNAGINTETTRAPTKKKIKQPNPLSVKRKKPDTDQETPQDPKEPVSQGKKRRRKHKSGATDAQVPDQPQSP